MLLYYHALCVVECDVIPSSKLQLVRKMKGTTGLWPTTQHRNGRYLREQLKRNFYSNDNKKNPNKNSSALQFLKFKDIYLLLLLRLFNVLYVLQKELDFFLKRS